MALARSAKTSTLPPRKKSHLSMRASGLVFVWTMLAIPIAQFIVFWLVPNFDSLLMAFQNPSVDGLTFMNFQRFWHELTLPNSTLVIAIENTLIYFAVHIFIGMNLGSKDDKGWQLATLDVAKLTPTAAVKSKGAIRICFYFGSANLLSVIHLDTVKLVA